MTLPTHYGFLHYADASRPLDEERTGLTRGRAANCYGRFDFATGQVSSYFAGNTHTLQECCFVPRKRSGAEGDGYLIGIANNLAEARSELIIADAQNLEAGDIARVILPFRSNVQVHGVWSDDADLAFGSGRLTYATTCSQTVGADLAPCFPARVGNRAESAAV